MDQLLKKYGASRSTMALAMSRQGILPDQLKPMSPSTFHNNVDPKIKMHEEARIKVHNAQRDVLLAELEMELKLLQPAIKKHGESHIELVLIPYKSVTGAKLVTSMTELPHLKTKINAEAVNVPESVEVPKWLDQDGDGIISKEEYQVLELDFGVFFVGFHLQPLLDGLDQPDLSRAWQSGKREKGKKKRKKTEKKEDRNRENREKRKQKQRKQKQRKKTEKQINRRKESETTPQNHPSTTCLCTYFVLLPWVWRWLCSEHA
jgi:hypothetical protein